MTRKKESVDIRIPSETMKMLQAVSKKSGASVNTVVNVLLAMYIYQQQQDEDADSPRP